MEIGEETASVRHHRPVSSTLTMTYRVGLCPVRSTAIVKLCFGASEVYSSCPAHLYRTSRSERHLPGGCWEEQVYCLSRTDDTEEEKLREIDPERNRGYDAVHWN